MLSAQDTAFSHAVGKPVTEAPLLAGSQAVLVAAVQVSGLTLPKHLLYAPCRVHKS